MRAYDASYWTAYFAALIGAAAALTGLLFVAVSINLDNILKGGRLLTARAAETLALLLLVLSVAALALVPQSSRLVGLEILVVSLPLLVVTSTSQLRHRRANPGDPLLWTVSRMTASLVAAVPAVIGGASLMGQWGGGFYWLVATTLLGIAGAVYSAWVLLVEILR